MLNCPRVENIQLYLSLGLYKMFIFSIAMNHNCNIYFNVKQLTAPSPNFKFFPGISHFLLFKVVVLVLRLNLKMRCRTFYVKNKLRISEDLTLKVT